MSLSVNTGPNKFVEKIKYDYVHRALDWALPLNEPLQMLVIILILCYLSFYLHCNSVPGVWDWTGLDFIVTGY